MDTNLWTRRSNTSKLSLATPSAASSTSGGSNTNDHPTRNYTLTKRFGSESATSSHSNKNPFNTASPSTAMPSPTTGKPSSAFGLGSGAFASFGGGGKTPKTPGTGPGNALDFGSKTPTVEKSKDGAVAKTADKQNSSVHPLRTSWTFWIRPPHAKSSNQNTNTTQSYEKSVTPILTFGTVEDFFRCYTHLKRPSALPLVSDYHLFRNGVRPVWEDEENKNGGKWVVKLKKGVADRYWEDLLLAVIGDQFGEEKQRDEEVMGVVLSMRNGEDVLSVWLKSERKPVKIRDTLKRVLNFPANTVIEWKSHDASISQRATIDAERKERPQADRQQSERVITKDRVAL